MNIFQSNIPLPYPFYFHFLGACVDCVRPVIDGFVNNIEKVPLLNIAGGIINDYQYLWENYYFPSISLWRKGLLTL